jgi:hypothetical protein
LSVYLFARTRRINPAQARAAVALAMEAAQRAGDITGIPIQLWTPVMSGDMNVMVWTGNGEHLVDFEVAGDKLAESNDFNDWIEQNDSLYQGPFEDAVLQVLHGSPAEEAPGYVLGTQAVPANGSYAEAFGIGVEIAQTAERLTGLSMMFGSWLTGTLGGVAWVAGAADLTAVETANAALAANDEWAKLIERAGHAYQEGATSTLYRRLT